MLLLGSSYLLSLETKYSCHETSPWIVCHFFMRGKKMVQLFQNKKLQNLKKLVVENVVGVYVSILECIPTRNMVFIELKIVQVYKNASD